MYGLLAGQKHCNLLFTEFCFRRYDGCLSITGIVVVFGSLGLYIGNVICGRILHSLMLGNILASPMMFFDTTPNGRIMNRFSKDIDMIDTVIPRIIESWLHCLLRVLSVPVVIGYSTPLFLATLLPLGSVYFIVQVW